MSFIFVAVVLRLSWKVCPMNECLVEAVWLQFDHIDDLIAGGVGSASILERKSTSSKLLLIVCLRTKAREIA